MFYPRDILPDLERELTNREITLITGMRRVGKTTILNHLFNSLSSKNKVILDLENPLHRKVFEEENFDTVWNNLKQFGINNEQKAWIFLDEVQNLPDISRVMKYLYDHWQVKFVLTGSSSFYLKNLFPESLAGRKIIFELFPLTFNEFLSFKNLQKTTQANFSEKIAQKNKISFQKYYPYYKEYIEFGGFPSVVLEKNHARKKLLLEEIFTSYFEKDAKNLADFRDMAKLRDLILLLIPRIGQNIEITKLASNLSISRETVYNYLSFLEQTYFIFITSKFSKSIDRRVAGGKKLYLCDGGVANILGKISLGQLFEQSIFQNLRSKHDLNFYNKEGRSEIDFIIDQSIALEAKLNASPQDLDFLKRKVEGLNLKETYAVSLEYNDNNKVILAIDL